MALYTIGDLHLSLGGSKPMDIFGDKWANHVERLRESFSHLTADDVTVLAGDLSWGISLEESLPDFQFIDALPGRKIILKGNHDYWWGTATKMKKFFEANGIESIDILFNNCFFYGDYALCGTRGWFYEEDAAGTHTGKMLAREALRLEASFKAGGERPILCFLHYPPLYQATVSALLELIDRYRARAAITDICTAPRTAAPLRDGAGETDYALVSADYLGFVQKKSAIKGKMIKKRVDIFQNLW